MKQSMNYNTRRGNSRLRRRNTIVNGKKNRTS